MLRQTLARSAWQSRRHAARVSARAFSASAQRPAEVELTIGTLPAVPNCPPVSRGLVSQLTSFLCRWQEGFR